MLSCNQQTKPGNAKGLLRNNQIEMEGYKCEVNDTYTAFIAASINLPYMEGNHSIPMNKHEQFSVSLDVYANIVCLCPLCHRLLHYGTEKPKRMILNGLYEQRAQRLVNSGIVLSKDEFVNMVM